MREMVGCTCVFWWKNIFNFVRDNVCSTLYTYMHVVLVWGGIYIYIYIYLCIYWSSRRHRSCFFWRFRRGEVHWAADKRFTKCPPELRLCHTRKRALKTIWVCSFDTLQDELQRRSRPRHAPKASKKTRNSAVTLRRRVNPYSLGSMGAESGGVRVSKLLTTL